MSVYSEMTALADKIRAKTGGTDKLTISQMAADVDTLICAEECDVTLTGEQYFFEGGGFCYTKVGSDGKIASSVGSAPLVSPGIASGTFRCVKGSTLIAYKWNGMPARAYTASTTGSVTKLNGNSTTSYTIMVFRVDGDGTITLT